MKILLKYLIPYSLLIGLIITGSMTMKHRFLLFSEHAPVGLVSFQFAGIDSNQTKILNEWDRENNYVFERDYDASEVAGKNICAIDVARSQIVADFYFIFFYVGGLVYLFWYYLKNGYAQQDVLQKINKPKNFSISYLSYLKKSKDSFLKKEVFIAITLMVVVAALADVVENIYMLKAFKAYDTGGAAAATLIKVAASIKFSMLFLALVVFSFKINLIKRLSTWLSGLSEDFLNLLVLSWKFRIVVILQVVFFLLLNFAGQGQDLMVTINNSTYGTIVFLISVSVLAALSWYLPKLYILAPKKTNLVVKKGAGFISKDKLDLEYARVLGIITFLVPAISMLKAMQDYHVPYLLDDVPALLILIISTWLTVRVIKTKLIERYYLAENVIRLKRYWLSLGLVFTLCIAFYFIQKANGFGKLSFLCMDLYLIAGCFLITITLREKLEEYYKFNIARLSIVSGLIVALFFVAFNFDSVLIPVTYYSRFLTLNIVLWALSAYALFFSFLLAWSKKIRIQLITILLLICAIGSAYQISKFHQVEISNETMSPRDSLNQYVEKWLEDRSPEIQNYYQQTGKAYPVYFVNSYGGGIRAAAWAAMVMGALDSLSTKTFPGKFQRHVFSYSGASGGTVGFSLINAAAASSNPKLKYPSKIDDLFKKDFLSGNIVGMFGRDVLMEATGLDLYDDRARLQERIVGYALNESYKIDYHKTLSKLYPERQTDLPLLFSNTYDINTGTKGIVAPVLLNKYDFPSTIFITEQLSGKDIPLSAVAFLSARFPYVSPTGKFNQSHHFTDGGTIENSGGQTSLQIIQVFRRIKSMQKFEKLCVSINILSISNAVPAREYPKPQKNLYEITAPVLGVLNTIGGNAQTADSTNHLLAVRNKWKYQKIAPMEIKTGNSWPVLPLGWQISDDALNSMKQSLVLQRKRLQTILDPENNCESDKINPNN